MREKLYKNNWTLFILTQLYFFLFNLNKTETKFNEISTVNFIHFFIHIFISFIIYFFSIKIYKKKGVLYGLFIISIFQFFIFYKQIAKVFLSKYINLGNKYFIYFVFILVLSLILFAILQKSTKHLLSIVKIFFISLVLLNIIEVIEILNKTENTSSETFSVFKKNSPNLILVIVDEMTSLDIINKKFNGDIQIRSQSFKEYKNTYSTHKETIFSINNLLNLGESKLSLQSSPINLVTKSLKNNKLIRLFKNNNYQIINQSIFHISNNEKVNDNIGFYFFENTTLTYSSFYNNMYVPFNVGFNKFLLENKIKKIDNNFYYNFKNENISKTNNLISLFKDTSNKKFAYFHLTVPHEPYCFDSNGNISKDIKKYYGRQHKDYINSAKFASQLIQKIIDSFENSSAKDNTILIIQGDHGARILDLPMTEEEKLAIFDYIFLPNNIILPFTRKHTNIEEMNYILNQFFVK